MVVRYIVLSYIGLLDQARTMVKLQEIGAMVFHSATRLGRAIESDMLATKLLFVFRAEASRAAKDCETKQGVE